MQEKKQFKKISPVPLPKKTVYVQRTNPVVCHGSMDMESPRPRPSAPTGTQTDLLTLYAPSDDGHPGHWKQWSIWREFGTNVLVTEWGKVGNTLQRKSKRLINANACDLAYKMLIRTKRAKGYRETIY